MYYYNNRQFLVTVLLLLVFCLTGYAGPLFTEQSASCGLGYVPGDPYHVMAVNMIDINSDGWDDIYVTPHAYYRRPVSPSLYINNGNGMFTEANASWAGEPDPFSGDTHMSFWGDYDNDGDPDMYKQVGGWDGDMKPHKRHFANNIDGRLIHVAASAGLTPALGSGRSGMWLDYNGDGRLDLLCSTAAVAARKAAKQGKKNLRDFEDPSILYRQNPDGTFTNASKEAGMYIPGDAFFGVVTDLKGDGILNLVLFDGDGNDNDLADARSGGDFIAKIYRLSGAKLVDETSQYPSIAMEGRDAVVADFNGDLVSDIFAVGSSSSDNAATRYEEVAASAKESKRAAVYLEYNASSGRYEDRSAAAGLTERFHAGSMAAGDFDNDGDIDVFILNQVGSLPLQPAYLCNQGNGTFKRVADNEGLNLKIMGNVQIKDFSLFTCVAVADLNNDGFLDIYTALDASENADRSLDQIGVPVHYFRNNGNGNNWIHIHLVGTTSNRDAIGARVILTAGGKSQMREANGRMGRTAQHSKRLHFGLGQASTVSSIQIYWPSGNIQTLSNMAVNQILTITENSAVDSSVKPKAEVQTPAAPAQVSAP